MFQHVLIPTDGSPLSQEAARQGIRFAAAIGARVTCFHAMPRFHASDVMLGVLQATEGDYRKAAAAYAEESTEWVLREAEAAGVKCDVDYATTDEPAEAIIAAAKRHHCDLILMASHGRRGVKGLLLGSETQKVLTHSTLPVLVYR